MMTKGPSDIHSLGLAHNFKTNGAQDISGQYSKGKYSGNSEVNTEK